MQELSKRPTILLALAQPAQQATGKHEKKIAVNSYGNYTLFVENKASELMNDGCRVGEGKA